MKKIIHSDWVKDTNWAKKMLVMKISIFLMLIAMEVSANNYAQQTISLHTTNTSLIKVLKSIEKQSSYRFFYSDDIVQAEKQVSISVKNATLDEVLGKVLTGLSLSWKVMDGNFVIISALVKPENSIPQRIISGKVVTSEGQTI